jgi:N-acetylglucosamine-6-phosphate deacetylase
MASTQPAAMLNAQSGELTSGARADFVLFQFGGALREMRIVATVIGGELVHGALG